MFIIVLINVSSLTSLLTALLANPVFLLRGSYGMVALRGGDYTNKNHIILLH